MNKIIKLNVIRRELDAFTPNLPPVVWCFENEWKSANHFVRIFRDPKCEDRIFTAHGAKVSYQKSRFKQNTIDIPKFGTGPTDLNRGGDFAQRIVNNAVLKASPHVAVILNSHLHIKAVMEDIIKEAHHRGIPLIAYESQCRLSVGLSSIYVSALDGDTKGTKMKHAGKTYTSVFIDAPFEVHHNTVDVDENLQAYMLTRIRHK